MQKTYQIKMEKYLKVDKDSENGIEYTWIEGFGVPVDGGIIEVPYKEDLTDEQILKTIIDEIGVFNLIEIKQTDKEIDEINPLVFRNEQSKIPLTREELAEIYWNGDKEKIEKYGYPIQRFALYSAECKCNGQGRFVLEETPKEVRENRRVQYIRCKNCGQRSYL